MSYGLKYGTANLAANGTAQQLSTTPLKVKYLRIIAPAANTGPIRFGGSDVTATTFGYLLPAAGGELELPMDPNSDWEWDLSKIWFDGTTTNDDIDFLYSLPS